MSVLTEDPRRRRDAYGAMSVLGWRLASTGRDLAARVGLLSQIQRLRSRRVDGQRADRADAVIPSILERIPDLHGELHLGSWQSRGMVRTQSDVMIIAAGPPEQPYRALIKVAETEAAAQGLDWQRQALAALRDDERLGDWRALLPLVLDSGEIEGTAYLVERRVRGNPLERVLRQRNVGDEALRSATATIQRLHRATALEATIEAELIDRWVSTPAALLMDVISTSRGRRAPLTAFARLTDGLRASLEGQPITLGWIHGDYGPGNILTGPEGHVSGIVDWEFAHPEGFPSLDVVTLLLVARMLVRRQELGRVVRDLVAAPTWTSSEAQLVAATPDAETWAAIGTGTVVLLCWLHHVAGEFSRRTRSAESGLWIHANIHSVLDAIR